MDKLPFENKNRKTLTKRSAETDFSYGDYPESIPISELLNTGIAVIDKPKGPTSHQVADYVKKILSLDKAGHSGTLDPGVCGVLPVALENSTKIVQVLLPAGKEYVALAHFHKELPEEKIRAQFEKFRGRITQLPPVKSAVKRQERQRNVYYIDILEIKGKDVLFRVGCQAGTYIRKLIHDIGKDIGGAHMAELRRTKAGPFFEDEAVSLTELSDALYFWKTDNNEKLIRECILPLESAVRHLPKVYVVDTAVNSLCHGADLKIPGISKLDSGIGKKDIVAVLSLKGELISIGNARMTSEKVMEKNNGIAIKTFRVFMQPGKYPKIKKS